MIKVVVSVDKYGIYKAVEFNGHALFADYGNDIVCSAVSVLAINTVNSIESFCDDKLNLVKDEKTGFLRLEFINVLSKEATLLVKSLILGLNGISDEYGKNFITITKEVL